MNSKRFTMKIIYCLAAVVVVVVSVEPPDPLQEFTDGNMLFTANTYKELAKKNVGQNFVVCPISVAIILALAEAGAGGRTAQQLITGLNLPSTEENIHEALKIITPRHNVSYIYTLSSANKIYVKEGYTLRQQFKDVAKQVFKSEIDEIDFSQNAVAAEKMNKWVLEKTYDKIKDLVSKNDLDENTRAVLINAIYFYGKWVIPFPIKHTTEKPFKISSSSETKVKMMELTHWFNYYEDVKLNAKFLEMGYLTSPLSMIFVVPNDVDGLTALEENIHEVVKPREFKFEKVHVQIPHVNIESKIDFIPILQTLGIRDAFEEDLANFTRLKDNEERLFINKIIQKTFIAVEETGTTAAAATEVHMGLAASAHIGPPIILKEFEANRPFIFILKSEEGSLFIGRYVEPNSE